VRVANLISVLIVTRSSVQLSGLAQQRYISIFWRNLGKSASISKLTFATHTPRLRMANRLCCRGGCDSWERRKLDLQFPRAAPREWYCQARTDKASLQKKCPYTKETTR